MRKRSESWQIFRRFCFSIDEQFFLAGAHAGFYAIGQLIFKAAKFNLLLSPIITAVVCLIAVLLLTGVPYETYFSGASFVHFLLGPATVALAVPLYEQRRRLARLWLPLACGLIAGCAAAIVSVVLIGAACGLSAETLLSMVPKSVTTPIAWGYPNTWAGCLISLLHLL